MTGLHAGQRREIRIKVSAGLGVAAGVKAEIWGDFHQGVGVVLAGEVELTVSGDKNQVESIGFRDQKVTGRGPETAAADSVPGAGGAVIGAVLVGLRCRGQDSGDRCIGAIGAPAVEVDFPCPTMPGLDIAGIALAEVDLPEFVSRETAMDEVRTGQRLGGPKRECLAGLIGFHLSLEGDNRKFLINLATAQIDGG